MSRPDYNKLERDEARKDGAKLVKNSGRGAEKGDAKIDGFLIDYKFNEKVFSLKASDWKQLKKDAWNNGYRDPLIVVCFGDGSKVAMINWDMFQDLRGENDGR